MKSPFVSSYYTNQGVGVSSYEFPYIVKEMSDEGFTDCKLPILLLMSRDGSVTRR